MYTCAKNWWPELTDHQYMREELLQAYFLILYQRVPKRRIMRKHGRQIQ